MDVLSIVLGLGTAIGGGSSAFMFYETRGNRYRRKRLEEIDVRVAGAVSPMQSDLTGIHTKLDALADTRATETATALHTALLPIREQLAVLQTKIEIPWSVLEQLAVVNAQMIHKPHPEHAEIDALLDAFVAYVQDAGPFSADQELHLRHYLTVIKNWRPGQDVGFPVTESDPTRAAILLATMDLTRIRRKQERTP